MSAFESVLEYSKRPGVGECEVSAITKKTITVRITDSEIAEIKENLEDGFGIRVINEKRISAYQTNDQGDIKGIIEELPRTPSTSRREFWQSLPHEINKVGVEGTFDKRLDGMDGSGAADLAQEMINSALHRMVSRISGSLNIVSERFEIGNSHGLYGRDDATYIAGMINTESESGNLPVSGLGQECCRTLDAFSARGVGARSKEMCIGSVNPRRCKGGRHAVIFEPYSVGEMLAFVICPNFSLRSISEKKSCFTDMRGEQIAAKGCNIIDDPHAPQGMGTRPFDDEGIATRRNALISDGVFTGFFSDLYEGYKNGSTSTGNAARHGLPMGRSAEPIPIPMPHNIRIMPGDMSEDELVKDTKHGLLIGRLWYTYALNPIRGDFSCTARSGIRIIEDGEIIGAGKPVRIIHNMPAMLQDVSGIGKDGRNVLQWASIPSITPAVKAECVPVAPT